MKIVFLDGEALIIGSPEYKEFEALGEVTLYQRTPNALAAERIGDADIVFTDSCKITRQVIDQCPNIRFIGIFASGFNSVDVEYAKEKGIPVRNAPGYAANNVSQHGFSLLLYLCNHINRFSESVNKGLWDQDEEFSYNYNPMIELSGKTIGIIGFGHIGRNIAKISSAFEMEVLVNSKSEIPSDDVPNMNFVSLEQLLENSDVVCICCALDVNNKHLINANTINKMKDGVILVNIARGGLIDEIALAQALISGKVRAAGLDVIAEESTSSNSPLIGLPNCVITPHIAWNSNEARERLIRISMDNLKEFLAIVK
jgi:glycerate dehydrogenase